MSKTLDTFFPLLVPEIPGAPLILLRKALLNAAIDFCERSFVWLETQAAYTVTSASADYDFTTTTAGIVHQLRSAELDGTPIDVVTREFADRYFPGWRPGATTTFTGVQAITQTDPTSFRLIYTPAQDGELVLEVAYKPTRTATVLPDILYDEYEEAMVCGAAARLLVMNNVPWTNPQAAAIHAGRFKEMYEGANLRQSRAFGRVPLRVDGQFQ